MVAILADNSARLTVNPSSRARSGCMKLSVLPLSTRQLTVTPLTYIYVIDPVKYAPIDAILGLSNKADAVDVLWEFVFGDDRHIFQKWPFTTISAIFVTCRAL